MAPTLKKIWSLPVHVHVGRVAAVSFCEVAAGCLSEMRTWTGPVQMDMAPNTGSELRELGGVHTFRVFPSNSGQLHAVCIYLVRIVHKQTLDSHYAQVVH